MTLTKDQINEDHIFSTTNVQQQSEPKMLVLANDMKPPIWLHTGNYLLFSNQGTQILANML